MPLKEITDRHGRKFQWTVFNGHAFQVPVAEKLLPLGLEARFKEMKNFNIREDDIMICTFPKTGTHWIWEIVSMVIKGKAEYETKTKTASMIDFIPVDMLDSLPSPRILNSHFAISVLPDQIRTKKIKIIHLMRNPKDIATSYFYHAKTFSWMMGSEKPFETFSEFLPYITGEYGVYSYVSLFRYLKEMEAFSKENPGVVLNLYFEDMLQNPTAAVGKVAQFLNRSLSDDVIRSIANKCSFNNLKSTDEALKTETNVVSSELTEDEIQQRKSLGRLSVFRKGQVGDWKNHFSVAENEQFDKLLAEELKDSNFKFTYTLDNVN